MQAYYNQLRTPKGAPRNTSTGFNVPGGMVYATATGLRVGARGRVQPAGTVLGQLPKGAARQLRKALHRAGYVAHAAAPRMGGA